MYNLRLVIWRRVDDSEQYGRRLSLLLEGIDISPRETPASIRVLILREIDRLDLEIDDLEVSRAHRYGIPTYDKHGTRKQTVIVRFVSWFARNAFYQARKRSKFIMKADLTDRRQNIINYARKMWYDNECVNSVINFVCVDKNCRMTAISYDDKVWGFSSKEEFMYLVDYLESMRPTNHGRFVKKYSNDIVENGDF